MARILAHPGYISKHLKRVGKCPLGYAFIMRHAKTLAVVSLAIACIAAAGTADARRYHHHRPGISLGFYVGAPLLAYSYWHARPYYPYYYAYPPVVVAPPAPPVYMEQQPAPAAQSGYWYYCAESNAYYPYVQQCAGPWQPVPPRPPQ